jgi:large subunit ribosomal protein L32e
MAEKEGEVIKQFTTIKGIGNAKAKSLYQSGYTSLEKLKKASLEELAAVKGISDEIAQGIINQLKEGEERLGAAAEVTAEEEIVTTPEIKIKEEEEIEVGEERKYQVKKKPDLDDETREKLWLRKKIKRRTPKFLREEWFRYKRISQKWRRPDGITSKMRMNVKYRPSKARVGYRGPRETRGLHPSGFEEVLVYTIGDIEDLDPKKQAARIGGTVGTKKRVEMKKKAEELDVRILNE